MEALVRELSQRHSFLGSAPIDTIYFGGGTPSQLPLDGLQLVLNHIHSIYNVREDAEVTLEGNPDDLSPAFLNALRQMGFNRLSMGVQTFSDERLRFLHRRHSAQQAFDAVNAAQDAGFNNISIDLMFGFPKQTLSEWTADVQQALALGVQHLSAYALMYEEGTLLGRMLERGEVEEIDEELSLRMYEHLLDATAAAGFHHYEISNFALPGMDSRHNSSYWRGIPYLGVGAGAHSYDGHSRSYNVESLADYIAGASPVTEELTAHERYDEYVFTALRTAQGIHLADLAQQFGNEMKQYCLQNARKHLEAGKLASDGDVLRLTRQGLFVSNDIMSDLMWVD